MTFEYAYPSPPGDGTPALAPTAPTLPTLTLRALVDGVASAVRKGVPREAWVEAAVVKVQQHKSGYAIELGENDPNGNHKGARLEAFLSDDKLIAIREGMGISDFDPTDLENTSAILRLSLSFHPHHHLRAWVQAVNPALGDSFLAKHRARIRERLEAENLLNAQSRLPTPMDVKRLAVVHPTGAAGWADVKSELSRLHAAGVIELFDFDATFEGPAAVRSLLDAIQDASAVDDLDLLMIIRGGGASSGLAALTNEALARAICGFPTPVLTGIGHASDRGLLDEVAWRAADTPSKALRMAMDLIARSASQAQENWSQIVSHTKIAVSGNRKNLDGLLSAAAAHVFHQLDVAHRDLDQLHAQLRVCLATARAELGHQSSELERLRTDLITGAPRAIEIQGERAEAALGEAAHAVQVSLASVAAGLPESTQLTGAVATLLNTQTTALNAVGEAFFAHASRRIEAEAASLADLEQTLRALSVGETLSRGFILVTSPDNEIVATADEASSRQTLNLHFSDGIVAVRVES